MEFERRGQVPVTCPNCDETFSVPKSMKGGQANCPSCRRAVPVGGGYEPLFWILLSLGVFFVLLISIPLLIFVDVAAGAITLAVGALILIVIVMAS